VEAIRVLRDYVHRVFQHEDIAALRYKIDEFVSRKEWLEAYEAGVELWNCSHDAEISDLELLNTYL
jgi:hypothetical protein